MHAVNQARCFEFTYLAVPSRIDNHNFRIAQVMGFGTPLLIFVICLFLISVFATKNTADIGPHKMPALFPSVAARLISTINRRPLKARLLQLFYQFVVQRAFQLQCL